MDRQFDRVDLRFYLRELRSYARVQDPMSGFEILVLDSDEIHSLSDVAYVRRKKAKSSLQISTRIVALSPELIESVFFLFGGLGQFAADVLFHSMELVF